MCFGIAFKEKRDAINIKLDFRTDETVLFSIQSIVLMGKIIPIRLINANETCEKLYEITVNTNFHFSL